MGEPGMTEACADCGEKPGRGEGVGLLFSRTDERFLCARCARTVLASRNSRKGCQYPEFAPLSMEDAEGRRVRFEVLTEDIDTGIRIQMVEAGKQGEGYELDILGDYDADILELFRSLNQRMRRALGRRHLVVENGSLQIRPEGVVRALIDADDDRDDGLPLLVIDGRPVSWEVFGRMLLRKYEGYQVKLEIYDLSEEIGDDSLDRSRYLMSKAGDRRLN